MRDLCATCQQEYARQAEEAEQQARYDQGESPWVLGTDEQVRRLVVRRICMNIAEKVDHLPNKEVA